MAGSWIGRWVRGMGLGKDSWSLDCLRGSPVMVAFAEALAKCVSSTPIFSSKPVRVQDLTPNTQDPTPFHHESKKPGITPGLSTTTRSAIKGRSRVVLGHDFLGIFRKGFGLRQKFEALDDLWIGLGPYL